LAQHHFLTAAGVAPAVGPRGVWTPGLAARSPHEWLDSAPQLTTQPVKGISRQLQVLSRTHFETPSQTGNSRSDWGFHLLSLPFLPECPGPRIREPGMGQRAGPCGVLYRGPQGLEGGQDEVKAEDELLCRVVSGSDERRGGLVEVGELVRR
jgi:hypothetical protein